MQPVSRKEIMRTAWRVYRLYSIIGLLAVLLGMLTIFHDAWGYGLNWSTLVEINHYGEATQEVIMMISIMPYTLVVVGKYIWEFAHFLDRVF